jgi:hypothetical protein
MKPLYLSKYRHVLLLLGLLPIFVVTFAQQAFHGVHVHYKFENDFLSLDMKGTDRYYTGGNRLGVNFAGKKRPYTLHTITMNVEIYTARGISRTPDMLTIDDYPYNGLSYLSYRNTRLTDDHKNLFRWGVAAGLSGSHSYAREMQVMMHKVIHYRLPLGWDSQLEPGPYLQIGGEHTYSWYAGRFLKFNTVASMEWGTTFNRVTVGTELKIGRNGFNFNEYELQVLPKMTGKRSGINAFIRPTITGVLYNRLLELENEKISTENGGTEKRDVQRLVAGFSAGVIFYGKRMGIGLVQHANGREFRAAGPHKYGEVDFIWRF